MIERGLAARGLSVADRLTGIDAAFEPGRITAICGPNGAGKSTLLSALAGLLAPTHGLVTLAGTNLAAMPPRERARRVGYLPQDGAVAWDVSVATLVALGRMPHGDARGGGRAAIDAALDAVDMRGFATRPVLGLSGGERARALLARVLAGEPDWILADEPLAALDLAHQHDLMAHLRRAASAGTGVLLVLHDLALAANHADTVLVLDRGRVAAEGNPHDSLSAETVRAVWGVEVAWTSAHGRRALVTAPLPASQ